MLEAIKVPSKRDYHRLRALLSDACRRGDGIAAGNASHKLRCRYGVNYKEQCDIACMLPADFDGLMQDWDNADDCFGKDYSF